jgi:malonyl-CoA O-methyltransferase
VTVDEASAPDPRAARRAFDRAARHAGIDVLAREVSRRMAARLDYVRLAPAYILDAGAGRGDDAPMLRARYPAAELVAVDWSLQALRAAEVSKSLAERARSLVGGRVPRRACADLGRLPFADGRFDLVWSNLSCDWAGDPFAMFRELRRVLAPGGLLMFSAYGPDTLVELRRAFASVDDLPHAHRFIDMHDRGDMLGAAGFSAPVMDMEMLTLTYADMAALFADLRSTGQTNNAAGRRRGMTGRRRWARLLAAGEAARRDGRIAASVEVVYGHAWAAESVRSDGRAPIRFAPRRLR